MQSQRHAERSRSWPAPFDDPLLDFAGGPYIPVWGAPPPDWIPDDYLAVFGSVDNGSGVRDFDASSLGTLKGGNAVIGRAAIEKVGSFAEHLGPGSFARLFSCDDEDMYLRLLDSGAREKYLPDLVIYHYIAEQRLTREYYRSRCFWRGVSPATSTDGTSTRSHDFRRSAAAERETPDSPACTQRTIRSSWPADPWPSGSSLASNRAG